MFSLYFLEAKSSLKLSFSGMSFGDVSSNIFQERDPETEHLDESFLMINRFKMTPKSMNHERICMGSRHRYCFPSV